MYQSPKAVVRVAVLVVVVQNMYRPTQLDSSQPGGCTELPLVRYRRNHVLHIHLRGAFFGLPALTFIALVVDQSHQIWSWME